MKRLWLARVRNFTAEPANRAGADQQALSCDSLGSAVTRYGYEGTIRAKPGRGTELLKALLRAAELARLAPGNELYVVGTASDGPDVIRVFEVWKTKEAHDQSLTEPAVRALIGEVVPLLLGQPTGTAWLPKGGNGLSP